MSRRPERLRMAAIGAVYLLLSAGITWPLLRDMSSRIASDAGDPVLNLSLLTWHATMVAFSSAWWNAPHYYPSQGVTTFTENLVGLSPFASPIYWLTGNSILAYNLTLFLTWPLSAFAAFLLARFLTRRDDAAFVAGLAFGFTPYRAAGVGHIQTLACFGVPLFLLGLHGYAQVGLNADTATVRLKPDTRYNTVRLKADTTFAARRWPWLLLFGAAWLQQSLANGYYVLYGAI